MVVPGKELGPKAGPQEVAYATLKVLLRTVPAAVPSLNFLSGGQTEAEATSNLNAMNVLYPQAPWPLSFSYARALQQPVLEAWRGKSENRGAAQQIFHQRARLNSFACLGLYKPEMEPAKLAA